MVLRVPGLVLPIELDDHVTRLDAGLGGWGIGFHGRDQRTLSLAQADGFGNVLGDLPDLHADAPSRDLAGGAQLVADAHGLVDRNREADPHETAGTRIDLAVDAHDLAAHVQQRAARVAGIDGHIGLDEGQIVSRVALLGADDACGDRVVEAEGRSDGHHPLTDLETVHVADLHGGQSGGIDLDHSHVGALVAAHDLGLELTLVGQRDDDLVSTFDHVGIGHHKAVRRQDEARPHATRLFLVRL